METLGAYLLRSGVLTRDTLAAALDRQVVYGGWLDTALLELGVLTEPALADTLATWAAYPVCGPGWLENADPAAVAALPVTLAVSYVVAPFAVSAEGLWIATTAPVDVEALAQLAASIGRPVLPHVTTEHRVRLALRALYGAEQDPRFEELVGTLAARQALPTEITEEPELTPVEHTPPSLAATAADAVSTQAGASFHGDVIQPAAEPAPAPAPAPAVAEPPAPPMDFAEALAHLIGAQDRDGIVAVTLRYAVQTYQCAAFLGVLRGQAVVWAARLAGQPADATDAIRGTRFPLDERSPLRTVVETRAPSLGRVTAASRAGASLPERLGRGLPRAMLLQPILVGGRVVAVLYGDNGAQPIRTKQASEVLAFASRVGLAFESIIRDRRARTLSTTPAEPAAPVEEALPMPGETMMLADAAANALAAQGLPPMEPWLAQSHGMASVVPQDAAPPPFQPSPEVWVVDQPANVVSVVPDEEHTPPALAPERPAPSDPDPDDADPPGESAVEYLEEPAVSQTGDAAQEPLNATTDTLFVDPSGAVAAEQAVVLEPSPDDDDENAEARLEAEIHAPEPHFPAFVARAPSVPPPLPAEAEPALEDVPEAPVADLPPLPVEASVIISPPTDQAPAVPGISEQARAIAAAALARLRAGDDEVDEDEDERADEQPITEDHTWNNAVQEALTADGHGDGSFHTDATAEGDAILAQQIEAAARSAGTFDKPVYQILPEDEEEEEAAPRPGEEVVVFAEVQDDANASAFSKALQSTIEQGHQGGEAHDEAYKVFAEEDEAEEEQPGWENVVFDAAAQVEAAARKSVPPELPADALQPVDPEAPSDTPVVLGTSQPPPIPAEAAAPPAPAAPKAPPPLPEQEVALIDPPKVWTEALLSGVPDRVVNAQKKLLELGESAVPALTAVFPGRISFDPFGPEATTPDPATLSPLLDLLVRMGATGLGVAVPHLDSKFPAHRYFATLLLSRCYSPAAIPYLLRRLHDDEPRIRKLAGDVLASYVAEPGFEQVLRHLRTRVTSVVPEGRRRAIHFLGRFRDVGAIPALIASLRAKEPDVSGEAAQSLHAITLQSFGGNDRKWTAWWEKNKSRSRIEWLIDALKDGDVEVRARAGAELSSLTRDTFGFKADAARKDRDVAIKRWETWWADERRRLMPPGQG